MRKPTVLVVEDEAPLVAAIKKQLEKVGLRAVVAANFHQAVAALKQNQNVEFAWIDHYLPGDETGLDLVTKIKTAREWSHIPIFVVSNSENIDRYYLFTSLTTVKYLVKSNTNLAEIASEIKSIIDKSNRKKSKK